MTTFKKKLQDKGLSLYRISKDTGIGWQTLHNWADGKTRPTLTGMFYDLVAYLEDKHGIIITLEDFKNGTV